MLKIQITETTNDPNDVWGDVAQLRYKLGGTNGDRSRFVERSLGNTPEALEANLNSMVQMIMQAAFQENSVVEGDSDTSEEIELEASAAIEDVEELSEEEDNTPPRRRGRRRAMANND